MSSPNSTFLQVGTPLSYANFIGSNRGEWYGLEADRDRFNAKNFYLRLRPEIPEVPGLYLTGQDVMTLGFVGAMAGGMHCAAKLLGLHNPTSLIRRDDDSTTSNRTDFKKNDKVELLLVAGQPAMSM